MNINKAICEMQKGKILILDDMAYKIYDKEILKIYITGISKDTTLWYVAELDLEKINSDRWTIYKEKTLSDKILPKNHLYVGDVKEFIVKLKRRLYTQKSPFISGHDVVLSVVIITQIIDELAGDELI